MARDHFQDIIPPGEPERRPFSAQPSAPLHQYADEDNASTPSPDKSIRNINITRRAAPAEQGRMAPRQGGSRLWLWILAGVCVLVLIFLGVLYLFGHTSVRVVPHSQPVIFDKTMQFTAYPASAAATGTLQYSIQSTDFEDSEPVAASGTVHKEEKASGTITVVNNYSSSPVKLLKNTRFESASGLIYRTPGAVSVPGKQGDVPGKVNVTVIADAAGQQYNVASGEKLTLPGLKPTAAMYAGVYATVASAFTGGFLGDAPNVSDSVLSAAQQAIRARSQQKVPAITVEEAGAVVPLQPIMRYTELDPVQENGSVKVRQSVHVDVPLIDGVTLSAAVAQMVAANSATITYKLVPGSDFVATVVGSPSSLGTEPITFTLTGSGVLVAVVDTNALAAALAGRDSVAFEGIVGNFPGVDSAHARIEPFWERAFPASPSDIRIIVEEPSQRP